MMDADQRWCRVTVQAPDGTVLADRVLHGPGLPDLRAVEQVARLGLLATRNAARLVVREYSPGMRELLELAALPVEVQGQPEGREEPLRVEEVEEEAHPGDPPA
jgi:hypothetical protein